MRVNKYDLENYIIPEGVVITKAELHHPYEECCECNQFIYTGWCEYDGVDEKFLAILSPDQQELLVGFPHHTQEFQLQTK